MAHSAHGRGREVRAWASHAGGTRRIADYCSGDLDLALRFASLDEVARRCRARNGNRAGRPWRADGSLLSALVDLERARYACPEFLLHRCQHGAVQLARMVRNSACEFGGAWLAIAANSFFALRSLNSCPVNARCRLPAFRNQAAAALDQRCRRYRSADLDIEPRADEPFFAGRGPTSCECTLGIAARAALPGTRRLP